MGKAVPHLPVKLIVGMIAREKEDFQLAQVKLSQRFGPLDFESQILPFDFTTYYAAEMGQNLKRKFISFLELIEPASLAEVKLFTNALETELSEGGARRINLDPGYISTGKLVLATTKNRQHRIYLGQGIYAEVTLRWKRKGFEAWEWTYPDYRTSEYLKILDRLHQSYMSKLRELHLFGD